LGRRLAAGIALSAAIMLSAASFAAEPKPDYALKTKAVEVSVFLDTAIEENTALAANCLAEGKAWAGKNRREAEASYKDDPQLFRNGGWTFERKYGTVSVVAGRYVSLTRSDYMNTGGAHPNSDINTILWDDAQKKRISVRPFLIETKDGGPTMQAILSLVLAALKTEKKVRGIDDSGSLDWYKDLKPSLLKVGAVALAPSTEPGKSAGFMFFYPPYAVGPYAEGSFTIFIPWHELKQSLSSEGAAIFGGNLPSGFIKQIQ
jgi:hypothetical protein